MLLWTTLYFSDLQSFKIVSFIVESWHPEICLFLVAKFNFSGKENLFGIENKTLVCTPGGVMQVFHTYSMGLNPRGSTQVHTDKRRNRGQSHYWICLSYQGKPRNDGENSLIFQSCTNFFPECYWVCSLRESQKK